MYKKFGEWCYIVVSISFLFLSFSFVNFIYYFIYFIYFIQIKYDATYLDSNPIVSGGGACADGAIELPNLQISFYIVLEL